MKKPKLTWAAVLWCACGAASTHAADWRPQWVYVQAAAGEHRTFSATAGLVWPWAWRANLAGGEVTGQTEAYLSHWSARATGGGRQSLTQLGLLPVLRWRPAGAAWFVEGGIGLSLLDKVYHTPDKRFSTAGNFHDMLGLGRSLGTDAEVGLRLVHFSNAGIKRPNPGLNFLQLRYAWRF